jgi:hypothetical protein
VRGPTDVSSQEALIEALATYLEIIENGGNGEAFLRS